MPAQTHHHHHGSKKKYPGPGKKKASSKRAGGKHLHGARLQRAIRFNKSRKFSRAKVRQIQGMLGVKADGIIGAQTTNAAYAFQVSRSGLSNDGMLGPATLRALQSGSNPGGKRGGALSVAQQNSAIRFNRQRNLKRSTIRKVQSAVGVPVDGIIGRITVNAVARYQAGKGLVADGKIGPATLRAMGLTNTNEPHTHPDPTPIDSGPVPRGNVTANFSWREFYTNDGTPVPAQYHDNVRRLAAQLEKIRAAFGGRSIRINSAYRHPAYNRRIGGASNSMHLYAKAADFNVSGVSPSQVRRTIEGLISRGRVAQGGMGAYNTFTHYDIRGSRSRW